MQNKYDIRNNLSSEINSILQKQKELEVLDLKIAIYKELSDLLVKNDINYIKDNSLMIPFLLNTVMDENKANKLYESILVSVNDLINLKNNNLDDTKDYFDSLTKFNITRGSILFIFKSIINRGIKLSDELKELNKLLPKYRKINTRFRYNSALNDEQITLLYDLMNKYNVNLDDQINAKEFIRIYNQKIVHPEYKISFVVKDMLNNKFDKIKIDNKEEIKYSPKLENLILSIYSTTIKSDNSYIELINEIKKQYNKEEYNYIIKSLINLIIDEVNETVVDLKENYDEIELRKVSILSYRELCDKLSVLFKMLKISRNEKEIEEEKQEEVKEDEIKNNILFVYNEDDMTALVEKDLKDIREEKLEEFANLIKGKKYGKLAPTEDTQLVSNSKLKGFRELRGDQTRIIYRNLVDNNILIVGSFIKKDDNDRKEYYKMAKRLPDTMYDYYCENYENLQEISEQTYLNIVKYVDENKRKGSR